MSPARSVLGALVLVLAGGGAAAATPRPKPVEPPAPRTGAASEVSGAGWLRIEYGSLVDRRQLTHSGEPVGVLLERLDGRGLPPEGERPDDALSLRLLDPVLEPYAFALEDALDATAPPHDPPLAEVGALWEAGEARPGWAELCRARRLILESDGDGFLRAILPAPSLDALAWSDALPETDPVETAASAWREAWPVLRHALAAERRRLARVRGSAAPSLEVEVHAYRHLPSRSTFVLGQPAWRTTVADTGPAPGTRPLDLGALQAILDRGLTIEGARIEGGGKIRWLTSEPDARPTILGRPPALSDVAVAYRAVARGGYGEAYMSLDRAEEPYLADVNYGGRLRDTALGMVSLLSDVRFKTFSVGIDLLGAGDVRAGVRKALPEFRTHLERFAADPTAGGVLSQQTRFWFYPDEVELTVSEGYDVLAFRNARMAAASERVRDAKGAQIDPPWTKETVSFLNARHDGLAEVFPEIGELDTAARLLAVFTWLSEAKGRGLTVPDLDALLALELPAVPTPRTFPELLSYDVLPPAGAAGAVEVFDQTAVGQALARLDPGDGRALPPRVRLARALARLDRRLPDQAALAAEIDGKRESVDPVELDQLSYRAERLSMHARVLATLPPLERGSVDSRRAKEASTRIFSVGIGGVDLGMRAALARASHVPATLGLTFRRGRGEATGSRTPAPTTDPTASATAVLPAETAGLPTLELPDHGLGPAAERVKKELAGGAGTAVFRTRPGAVVARGTARAGSGEAIVWEEVRLDDEGPELRARRRVGGPQGSAPVFERVESGRWLSYRFERSGPVLKAVPAVSGLPADLLADAPVGAEPPPAAAPIPEGLATLQLDTRAGAAAGDRGDLGLVPMRIRAAARDLTAQVPRAVLQRLVLGRDVDLTPERPLAGFTPPRQVLGVGRCVMVLETREEALPPWRTAGAQRPGEEDAARLARALAAWWSSDPDGAQASAVVGTDAVASAQRWASGPRLDGAVRWLVPDDAFPGVAVGLRQRLPRTDAGASPSPIVMLASAEPPGVLGRRLRALARDPAMKGKVLVVAALGGALREDLPASLLAEGRLAALGLVVEGAVGGPRAADAVAAWAASAGSADAKGKRPEEIPGPLTWYY